MLILKVNCVVIVACHLTTVIEKDGRDHLPAAQDKHGLYLVIDHFRLHAIEIGAI